MTFKTAQKIEKALPSFPWLRGAASHTALPSIATHHTGTCLLAGRKPPLPGWRVGTSGTAQFLRSLLQRLLLCSSPPTPFLLTQHDLEAQNQPGRSACDVLKLVTVSLPARQEEGNGFWSHSKSTFEWRPLAYGPSAEDTITVPGTGEGPRDLS